MSSNRCFILSATLVTVAQSCAVYDRGCREGEPIASALSLSFSIGSFAMEPGDRLEDVIVCRLIGGGLIGFLVFVACLVDGEPRGLAAWSPAVARRAGEARTWALVILVCQAFAQCAHVALKYMRVLCSVVVSICLDNSPLSNYDVVLALAISPAGYRGRAAGVMLWIPTNLIVCDRLSRAGVQGFAMLK